MIIGSVPLGSARTAWTKGRPMPWEVREGRFRVGAGLRTAIHPLLACHEVGNIGRQWGIQYSRSPLRDLATPARRHRAVCGGRRHRSKMPGVAVRSGGSVDKPIARARTAAIHLPTIRPPQPACCGVVPAAVLSPHQSSTRGRILSVKYLNSADEWLPSGREKEASMGRRL